MSKAGPERQTWRHRLFRNEAGERVIGQKPNLAILLWVIAEAGALFTHGVASQYLRALAYLAVSAWAWMELFQGESLFRRILGAVVMVWVLVALHRYMPHLLSAAKR